MKRLKQISSLLALLLGLLGIVACVVATVVVWSTGSRLSKASENVFDGVDKSLMAVRDRVSGARSEFKIRKSRRKISSKAYEVGRARKPTNVLRRDLRLERRLSSWRWVYGRPTYG